MKKSNIEVGQCYRWDDRVYMVLHCWSDNHGNWVNLQDTLTLEHVSIVRSEFLIRQQRPFPNWG